MNNFPFLYGSAHFFLGEVTPEFERVFHTISNTLKFVERFSATRCVYIRDETPCLMLCTIISN